MRSGPQAARNVASQTGDKNSVLEFYRQMLAFRKSRPEMVDGKTTFYDTGEPVFAFRRAEGKSATVCVFNLSKDPVSVGVTGAATGTGPKQSALLKSGQLELGPNGFALLDCAVKPDAVTVTYRD